MAADMPRKKSSECPDGTLAPSDGQSVERAESPTPGMAQGMEPGTGKVFHPRQPPGQSGFPTKLSLPLTRACVRSPTGYFSGTRATAGTLSLLLAFLCTSC